MTPTDLRHLLLDLNLTISQLAQRIPRPRSRDQYATRSHVSQVVHGHLRTAYVRRGIAEAVGKSYSEVWGEPDPKTLTPVQKSGEGKRGKRARKPISEGARRITRATT